MEIIFYHRLYTHGNGEPMHNKHDLNSIAQPFILRTTFGFNWVYVTLLNKYRTSNSCLVLINSLLN